MVKTRSIPGKPKNAPAKLRRLIVTLQPSIASQTPRGRLQAGATIFPCAIGAASLSRHKREGDKATPMGHFRLLEGFFKPGIGRRPMTLLPFRPVLKTLGWCEDPNAAAYNRLIHLPSRAGHETLWRDDGIYDLVIVLDYNIDPRRRNLGSAIFLHCARPGFAPTAGCIALNAADLRKLLPRLARDAKLIVR
jgi:L,D-peptidoglycan transpeptidase YkuD (ErfK/YbiS/YcfS/YnhG family)